MNRLSAAALLLFVSAAGYAQEAAPSGAQANTAPAATNDPIVVEAPGKTEDKVVCRRETALGSIRARRVCRTESQIAGDETRGQRTLDSARTQRQSQSLSQNHSGG
jgi:hypothetical protein